MAKPSWREDDETPKRNDDVHLQIPWFKYDGSGRLLAILLVSIGLLAVSFIATGYMWYHDTRTASDHQTLIHTIENQTRAQEQQTCVLTLNEQERREYRTEGKYCSGIHRPRVSFNDDRDPSLVWRGIEAQAKGK